MPELPEVETTRRGIAPHILNIPIHTVNLRETKLRWPISRVVKQLLPGLCFIEINRRGKYLLLNTTAGTLIIHLGMSGSLRLLDSGSDHDKHDHVDIVFTNGKCLRFRDPRKFGAIIWTKRNPHIHPLLTKLGPEPLGSQFNAQYLYQQTRKRSASIKNIIMNSHIVVGVGNIYASEALFLAGIRPGVAAKTLSRQRCNKLCETIKTVLQQAIRAGGTTLKDFTQSDGNPGYFKQQLLVYGRENQECLHCGHLIKRQIHGQRSSFYCPHCQK